jgi:hypothetical protein
VFAHTGSNCEPAVTGADCVYLYTDTSIDGVDELYVLLVLAVQGRIRGKLWPPAFVSSSLSVDSVDMHLQIHYI